MNIITVKNPLLKLKRKVFRETYKNKTLEFVSVSGVFAFENRIDKASRLLIKDL